MKQSQSFNFGPVATFWRPRCDTLTEITPLVASKMVSTKSLLFFFIGQHFYAKPGFIFLNPQPSPG